MAESKNLDDCVRADGYPISSPLRPSLACPPGPISNPTMTAANALILANPEPDSIPYDNCYTHISQFPNKLPLPKLTDAYINSIIGVIKHRGTRRGKGIRPEHIQWVVQRFHMLLSSFI
jgi:hypothetical protein